jgi:hypothetical protein
MFINLEFDLDIFFLRVMRPKRAWFPAIGGESEGRIPELRTLGGAKKAKRKYPSF